MSHFSTFYSFRRLCLLIFASALVCIYLPNTESAAATFQRSRSVIHVLCYTTEQDENSAVADPCAQLTTLFINVTVVRKESDFPADLSAFDVVTIASDDSTFFESLASQLNAYVQNGGGLIVSAQNLTTGAQLLPPGFEVTVTDLFWPGFPSAAPPAVILTNEGSTHPILNGLTQEEWVNGSVIPIDSLGASWMLLARTDEQPDAALAVGTYGSGRLVLDALGRVWEGEGEDPILNQFVQQMFEWAGQASDSPDGPDVQVDALEVTQAIQDLHNSVDLIANKRTFVRVHVSAPERVANVTAHLSAVRSGKVLSPTLVPANQGFDIMIDSILDRGQLHDSFLFELPSDWLDTGTITLTATLDPYNAVVDPDRANNVKSVAVDFLEVPPLSLRLYNVHYVAEGTIYRTSDFHINKAESWLRRAYPISDLQVKRTFFFYPEEGPLKIERLFLWLGRARWLTLRLPIESANTYHYGMVDDGGIIINGQAESIPGRIAIGSTGPTGALLFPWDQDGSYGDHIMGHEIGHLLGRSHADFCNVGENNFVKPYPYDLGRISPTLTGDEAIYGFDIENFAVYDPNWRDVMTYCDYRWISDFTYEAIREVLTTASAASLPTVSVEKYLIVSGVTDLAGSTIEELDIQLISQDAMLPLPKAGDWTIALLNSAQQELATYSFSPQRLTDSTEENSITAIISEAVPWIDGASTIEIRDSTKVVASRSASATAPIVTITTPKEDQQLLGESLQFDWSGTDADKDTLTYSVLYRHKPEGDWAVLTTNLISPTFTIDSDLLPGGTVSYLQIIASDGFLTGVDTVGPFTVPASKPVPTITSPIDDAATFYSGQLITLQGGAYDLENGQLEDSALTWASDIDGDLGAGAIFQSANLSTGVHTITLTATDSDGNSKQAQRTLAVLSATAAEPNGLSVAPLSHSIVAPLGETTTFSTSLTIRNSGDSTLDWTASSDAAWLSVSESSGSTPMAVTIQVDATGLPSGTYQSSVIFVADDATNSPKTVPVILTVPKHTQAAPISIYLPLVSKPTVQ